jgi:murein DD-endopeptidase MepM/ murein hydrolase activator NlpD
MIRLRMRAAGALILALGASLAAQPQPSNARSDDAALARMERRIAGLEARLGIAPTHATPFHTRYAELQRREARVAARADSMRAWTPDAAPLAAGTITSAYAARRYHPVARRVLPHWGLDVAAPHGAPVLATADGVVLATFRSPSYGTGVDLRHGDAFITRYAHLSALAVRSGVQVRKGQVIGYVGATGRTTGPHLHYEIYARRDEGYHSIDPARLLPPGARWVSEKPWIPTSASKDP